MTRSAAQPAPTAASFIALAAASLALLSGCMSGSGAGEPQEPAPAESEPQLPADGLGDTDCVVGQWGLVMADYRLQSEQYLLGLGVPITEFDMLGGQTLTITPDGMLSVATNIRTSGVIVAGDTSVPISVTTDETATGEWGWDATDASGGLLEVAEWQVVDTSTVGQGLEGLEVPPPRFEGENAMLLVNCDAETMLLQGGGPLVALFERL